VLIINLYQNEVDQPVRLNRKYSGGKGRFRWSVELKTLGNAEVTYLKTNVIYIFHFMQKNI
jgi:hypothetical protein